MFSQKTNKWICFFAFLLFMAKKTKFFRSFFGRICGSTILFRDLLPFKRSFDTKQIRNDEMTGLKMSFYIKKNLIIICNKIARYINSILNILFRMLIDFKWKNEMYFHTASYMKTKFIMYILGIIQWDSDSVTWP